MDIARNKGGNGMKILGFIYMTDNNILIFKMITFIYYDCFNATAEPRDGVDSGHLKAERWLVEIF